MAIGAYPTARQFALHSAPVRRHIHLRSDKGHSRKSVLMDKWIKTEQVFDRSYDCWDVQTDKERYCGYEVFPLIIRYGCPGRRREQRRRSPVRSESKRKPAGS